MYKLNFSLKFNKNYVNICHNDQQPIYITGELNKKIFFYEFERNFLSNFFVMYAK